jgi:hypothetical protein
MPLKTVGWKYWADIGDRLLTAKKSRSYDRYIYNTGVVVGYSVFKVIFFLQSTLHYLGICHAVSFTALTVGANPKVAANYLVTF